MAKVMTEDGATLTYDGTRIDDPDALLQELQANSPHCLSPAGYAVGGDLDAVVERQSIDRGAMKATFTIVTRTKDVNRHGNRVQILPDDNGEGLQVDDYKTNPTVLFDHGLSGIVLPIGNSRTPAGELAMRFLKTKADADVFFSQVNPDAPVIFGMIDEDMLRMASIGFIATKGMRIKLDSNVKQSEEGVEDLRWPFGWDFVASKLLEWSVTPVGADAGAIRKSLDRQKINGYRIGQGLRMALTQYAEKPAVWAPGVTLPKPVEQAKPAAVTMADVLHSIEASIVTGFEKISQQIVQRLDTVSQRDTTPATTVIQPPTIDPAEVIAKIRQQTQVDDVTQAIQSIPGLVKSELQKLTAPVIEEQNKFTQRLNTALGKV